MKTDNIDWMAVVAIGLPLIIFIGIFVGTCMETAKEIKFAEAGLVQKETPQGKIIWVKPELLK